MGPLSGIRVIEVGGIGPAPFCGMLLADMGAEVMLIERRPEQPGERGQDFNRFAIVHRGKKSVAMDLKQPGAAEAVLRLVARSDLLVEGFRPGVMERLGLGPEACLAANPRLVYGRITGWGQEGPLAQAAGHDINYIALSGALFHGGHAACPPAAPPTLLGDLGGGAMMLAVGLLAGLLNARETGRGQVIDAAICDGTALLTVLLYGLQQQGMWIDRRQGNFLDGGAHWYDCYECADGNYVSIGALEPAFYRELVERLGLASEPLFAAQFDPAQWPEQKEKLAALIRTRTRDEWCELLEGSDACFAPVLSLSEAPGHRHNAARGTFVDVDDVTQPAPAPRFSATPSEAPRRPPATGEHTVAVLKGAGFSASEITRLRKQGII
ncbi:MAG TPA: CaiB/BaiF CoA-transferase family protein [Woeseiaceae bacterium]